MDWNKAMIYAIAVYITYIKTLDFNWQKSTKIERGQSNESTEICFVFKTNRLRLERDLWWQLRLSTVAVWEHAWAGILELSSFHLLTLYSNPSIPFKVCIYRMVLKKFSFKNSKFYTECMAQ